MKIRSYRKELEEQLAEIRELMKKSSRNLGRFKDLPNSHVYISKSNGCPQYYIKIAGEARHYVPVKEVKNIIKFAQRDYEKDMNDNLEKLEIAIESFLNEYDPEVLDVYDTFSEAKKSIIKPLIATEGAYVDQWLEEHPGMQNPFPETGNFITNRGERVRSKSEKIIADALDKHDVPYSYEPMLELDHSTVYPDFAVLNRRTRKTLFWEHFGMISDPDYVIKSYKKIQLYENRGYLLGRDLITTMESADMPIDTKLVENKITEFLV